jgi:hypothetical protein
VDPTHPIHQAVNEGNSTVEVPCTSQQFHADNGVEVQFPYAVREIALPNFQRKGMRAFQKKAAVEGKSLGMGLQ